MFQHARQPVLRPQMCRKRTAVGADGSALPAHLWAQYGLAGVLEHEGFIRDVTASATASGVA
ncbi:hypothetical protein C6A85_07375, partial [Mycobacterium sp. ITM-2017-0098]